MKEEGLSAPVAAKCRWLSKMGNRWVPTIPPVTDPIYWFTTWECWVPSGPYLAPERIVQIATRPRIRRAR